MILVRSVLFEELSLDGGPVSTRRVSFDLIAQLACLFEGFHDCPCMVVRKSERPEAFLDQFKRLKFDVGSPSQGLRGGPEPLSFKTFNQQLVKI